MLNKAIQMPADAFAHEIIIDLLNSELEAHAKKVLMNCKLMVYKVKTVKKGSIDLKQLLSNVEENQKKKVHEENPEAQNLITKQQGETA